MDKQLEQLGERIAEQAAHLDAAKHRLLTDLREFDERGGWHAQGAMSCAHWLSWRVGWDLVTARDHIRVARKLVEFAAIDDALRRGEVSYSKVRAMLRAATPENETLLLEYAKLMTASQLEKLGRKYALVQRHGKEPHPLGDEQRRYVRRRDTEDGMVKIEAVLHPEEAEMVWTMLDHAATRLARETEVSNVFDSAESCGPAHRCEAQAAPSDAADCTIGDIAESHEAPFNTTAMAEVSTASDSPQVDLTRFPDSEKSLDRPSAPCTTAVTAPPGYVAFGQTFDSAESLNPSSAPCTAPVTAPPGHASPSQAPSRSLLDQLLDEADALPGADRVPLVEPEASSRAHAEEHGASVLKQRSDATRRAFSRADALVLLAQGYLRGDQPSRSPVEIVVTIPEAGLHADATDPLQVGEIGASFVSGQTARRLACDAGVIEVVEDEQGVPLSVGRKRRTIAGAIKRALHKRDTMCTFPSCTNRLFLEGHHVKHWADGGETSLTNTALICSLHHRFVHEYGYTVELGSDLRPRFRDPHGRLVAAVPAGRTTAELAWPQIRAANEPLAINADTIAGPWDGTPVDYGRIVGHLATADGLR